MNNATEKAMSLNARALVLETYPVAEGYDTLDLDEVCDEFDRWFMRDWKEGDLDSCTFNKYENENSYLKFFWSEYFFTEEEKNLILLNYCLHGSVYDIIEKHVNEMYDEYNSFMDECMYLQEQWEEERDELNRWFDRQRI